MRRAILIPFLSLVLLACESGTPFPGSVVLIEPPSALLSQAAKRPPIALPRPRRGAASADIDFGILYATNAKSFYASLVAQFQNSMTSARDQGILTEAERAKIVSRVLGQQRLLNRSLNLYITRLNRLRAASAARTSGALLSRALPAVLVTLDTPFSAPVRQIPGAKRKARLESIRKMLGQMELFSGFGISFTDALTNQIVVGATASQQTLAASLQSTLNSAFRKDIRAIKFVINLANIRRFRTFNRGRIDPVQFVGDYSGTCTNLANGAVENISATIAFDPGSGQLDLTFPRPTNLYGPGAIEMFMSTFGNRGLRFASDDPLFGTIRVNISRRGFISGRVLATTINTLDFAKYWGVAKKSDNSILIDVRMDFPEFDQGGSTQAVMELTKDP